jgi:acetyl-CoA C-acetyltransferase
MKSNPIFVKGIGWASGKSHLATRIPGTAEETKWAARRAYKMAGILRPENDIDVAEINDWYAHRELMHCEALGLNGGKDLSSCIETGVFEKSGNMPVNSSGGLLGTGNPTGGAGLLSVARIVEQLRGTAGDKQIPGVRYGLAHGWNGLPLASAGVAILSNC